MRSNDWCCMVERAMVSGNTRSAKIRKVDGGACLSQEPIRPHLRPTDMKEDSWMTSTKSKRHGRHSLKAKRVDKK